MYAFLTTQTLPTRDVWQAALDRQGYPVQLDVDLDLSPQSFGYSPCVIEGTPSGFELFVDPVASVAEAYPHLTPRLERCVWAVAFRWGRDLLECACVVAAAAALLECGAELVYYPPDDVWLQSDELRSEFDVCRNG
jgi:hypothetical protein